MCSLANVEHPKVIGLAATQGMIARNSELPFGTVDSGCGYRSLTALALLNLVVLMPMNVLSLLHDYELVARKYLQTLAYIAFFSYAVSSTINAIVVCILSEKHRTQMIRNLWFVFCCRCGRAGRHRLRGSQKTSDYRMERMRTTTTATKSTTDDYDSHSTSTVPTKYY
jgi:hypothetical protein